MGNNTRSGIENPHPFSQMKIELIWEGKHLETATGNRDEL